MKPSRKKKCKSSTRSKGRGFYGTYRLNLVLIWRNCGSFQGVRWCRAPRVRRSELEHEHNAPVADAPGPDGRFGPGRGAELTRWNQAPDPGPAPAAVHEQDAPDPRRPGSLLSRFQQQQQRPRL